MYGFNILRKVKIGTFNKFRAISCNKYLNTPSTASKWIDAGAFVN